MYHKRIYTQQIRRMQCHWAEPAWRGTFPVILTQSISSRTLTNYIRSKEKLCQTESQNKG